jgi:hypothetical protein
MALLKHDASLHRLVAVTAAIFDTIPSNQELAGSALDNEQTKAALIRRLNEIRKEPAVADMRVIWKQIDRAIIALQQPDVYLWMTEVREVATRINDQLEEQIVYIISPTERRHYEDPLADWTTVPSQFPSARDYIEEAEKAYALGLPTACVFHCMGVMHWGLLALAADVNRTPNPITDTWETIIGAIESGAKEKRDSFDKAAWKTVEPFYSEALSDLRSIKDAWRNPTMHFTRTYTNEQADKARVRVRDFMVHLSTRLSEKRTP